MEVYELGHWWMVFTIHCIRQPKQLNCHKSGTCMHQYDLTKDIIAVSSTGTLWYIWYNIIWHIHTQNVNMFWFLSGYWLVIGRRWRYWKASMLPTRSISVFGAIAQSPKFMTSVVSIYTYIRITHRRHDNVILCVKSMVKCYFCHKSN